MFPDLLFIVYALWSYAGILCSSVLLGAWMYYQQEAQFQPFTRYPLQRWVRVWASPISATCILLSGVLSSLTEGLMPFCFILVILPLLADVLRVGLKRSAPYLAQTCILLGSSFHQWFFWVFLRDSRPLLLYLNAIAVYLIFTYIMIWRYILSRMINELNLYALHIHHYMSTLLIHSLSLFGLIWMTNFISYSLLQNPWVKRYFQLRSPLAAKDWHVSPHTRSSKPKPPLKN